MGNWHRRFVAFLAISALVAVFGPSVQAEANGPLPDSCRTHPRHVVNPGCVPALASDLLDPEMTLPNLVPDVPDVLAYDGPIWDPDEERYIFGRPHLGFTASAQNFGTVPFQLTMDQHIDPVSPDVSQCVSWIEPRVCREQRPVGGFTFHAAHSHFHYEDFATYELRRVGGDGRADYSDAGLVRVSDKVSFCLIDSERVRDDASPTAFYGTCSQTVQGVSAGWADVYDATLPGQQFDLEGVSDGIYAIVVTLNKSGHLYETDVTDNVVEVTIELSNGLTEAAIVGRNYP